MLSEVFFVVKTCEKFHATRGEGTGAGKPLANTQPLLVPVPPHMSLIPEHSEFYDGLHATKCACGAECRAESKTRDCVAVLPEHGYLTPPTGHAPSLSPGPVPVVQQTWAGDAGGSIAYYSDVEEASIPTVPTGVANTEQGHCAKLAAILADFLRRPELRGRRWLVVADDDTLLRSAGSWGGVALDTRRAWCVLARQEERVPSAASSSSLSQRSSPEAAAGLLRRNPPPAAGRGVRLPCPP